MHDLVIRGGTVVDGNGGPPRCADVAVDDGVITAVGDDVGAARRTIDADGLVVTPGVVDVHTHYDGQVTWDPDVTPSSWHGVTSVVMGNCGVGFAPVRSGSEEWLVQLMEGVEDIPGTALTEGISWEWAPAIVCVFVFVGGMEAWEYVKRAAGWFEDQQSGSLKGSRRHGHRHAMGSALSLRQGFFTMTRSFTKSRSDEKQRAPTTTELGDRGGRRAPVLPRVREDV